ncbi:NAD-dependent epimerase/dehydratase family protein [Novosphingobium sp. YAF33]|uniref:NAD-dependent epimerase/dehydratase family protein n=1 Tax=Novosphingobium sp. YAF33 TaxID=3233082 RepID=UPI003F9C9A71
MFPVAKQSSRPDDGRVVSNLICQALSGRNVTIYGDGTQTRSFCYVSDMVDGLIRLMESETEARTDQPWKSGRKVCERVAGCRA